MATFALPQQPRKRWMFIGAWLVVALALVGWLTNILSGEATTLLICLQYFALRMLDA